MGASQGKSKKELKEEAREWAITKENEVAEQNKIEYRIVVEISTITLTERVNSLLNEGWKLQGGVSGHTQTNNNRNSIPSSSHQQMWAQAMIKKY
jgi:hypothetical protein